MRFNFFLTPDERQKSPQVKVDSRHQTGLRNKSSSTKTYYSDNLRRNNLSNTKNKLKV